VVGGIAAGVVVFLIDFVSFGFLFNGAVNSAYAALGLNFEDGGPAQLVIFIGTALMTGVAAVWLYAAIRPRFGAGPRTAAIAGIAVWFLYYLLTGVSSYTSLFPSSLVVTLISVGLIESLVATQVGAYLYSE